MKKLFFILLATGSSFSIYAQQTEWKEMKEFHEVMSTVFHPSEENNLQPLKEKAGTLFIAAKAWASSKVPEDFSAVATKPILKQLVSQCKAIKKSVEKTKPDEALKTMITEAHETFHEIMEKCRK